MTMHRPRRLPAALALALAMAGCQPNVATPPTTTPRATARPSARPTLAPTLPADPTNPALLAPAGVIARDGASVISRDGASVIARDGASLTGVARLPAGVIARDGASVISRDGASVISRDGASVISRDGASYRLAALAEPVPVRNQLVYLMDAAGRLVLGADGEPMTAVTDAEGRYAFKGFVTGKNMLLGVQLLDDKGMLTALVPRGDAAARTVDLTLASTLTATYIQERFLRPQADPVATLDKLPAALEASTREAVAAALTAAPATLKGEAVVGFVDGLRGAEAAVETQFKEVERVLLAGLSDGGVGQPADSIEIDAGDVAVAPDGQPLFAIPPQGRVLRKDAQGRVSVVAGSGLAPGAVPKAADPAPGDGGPATAAAMAPVAIATRPDGTLLIADAACNRVRAVAADGTIRTVVASDAWAELRDVVPEADGGLLVATHAGVWRVPPGGAPVLIAGQDRAFDPVNWTLGPPATPGGKPLETRFWNICSVLRDPASGDVLVADTGGSVFRVGAAAIERWAGTGVPGFGGDGGPAAAAQLGALTTLALGADGAVLVADPLNYRLRAVSDGKIRTIAGSGGTQLTGDGGPATAAGLVRPAAVAAADGAIMLIDDGYVRRIGADGKIATIVGGTRGFDVPRPADQVQLAGAGGLVYDAAANAMWVTDERHVWRWTLADNRLVSVFGAGAAGAPFTPGQAALATGMNYPSGLLPADDGSFSILANDRTTFMARILRVADGKLTSLAGGNSFATGASQTGPADQVAVGALDGELIARDGWIYYGGPSTGAIFRFKPGGDVELFAGLEQTGQAFRQVHGFAAGPDGKFYVGTPNYIYRLDPETRATEAIAGMGETGPTADGAARAVRIHNATGFAWDAAGDLYFGEEEPGRVRRLRQGMITTVAGAGTTNLAGTTIDTGLGTPNGLAFDAKGDLYVADRRFGQIKVIRKERL